MIEGGVILTEERVFDEGFKRPGAEGVAPVISRVYKLEVYRC